MHLSLKALNNVNIQHPIDLLAWFFYSNIWLPIYYNLLLSVLPINFQNNKEKWALDKKNVFPFLIAQARSFSNN